jgi:pyruvate dehydrogenase E2 component (dihydrolipoamide acetyltransferase)
MVEATAAPYEIVPLTPMRRAIATRMAEASQQIPHFRASAHIEIESLLALRRRLRQEDPAAPPASMNDWLIKACAEALMVVPAVNVQWASTAVHRYRCADIAVVVALDGVGLLTPIIRKAEQKSVWQIGREMRALLARAKSGALKVDEIMGGSFSLSNLGMYGVDEFDAIINPPQCAILAVGAARSRPVAGGDGKIRVATQLTATLSCDHRAIDGVAAAEFLTALRQRIEEPDVLAPRFGA